MRYIVALALLLCSSIASAQVYKCTHGGQVAYQDTPCAQDQQSKTMDVGFDPIGDLMGCFMAVPNSSGTRNTGFIIEVRTNLDGYELVARGGLYPQKFQVRRATRHELDVVDEATHMHMRAGLAVKKWNPTWSLRRSACTRARMRTGARSISPTSATPTARP